MSVEYTFVCKGLHHYYSIWMIIMGKAPGLRLPVPLPEECLDMQVSLSLFLPELPTSFLICSDVPVKTHSLSSLNPFPVKVKR